MNHRDEAERLLSWLHHHSDQPYFEADIGQCMAIMALAHATLAGPVEKAVIPDGITPPAWVEPPINAQEPVVLFQGPAAKQRVECARLANEEYTKRHRDELLAMMNNEG